MEERRHFLRLDISVVVKWKKITGENARILDKEASSKNISAGGICIIVERRDVVAIGDILALEIGLPTGKVVNLTGKVVWINAFEIIGAESEKNYETGVEFIEIKKDDANAIQQFVFRKFQRRMPEEG